MSFIRWFLFLPLVVVHLCWVLRGVARAFIMLKPTTNGELIDIWPSYQIANNKGADQTARIAGLRLCCSQVTKSGV